MVAPVRVGVLGDMADGPAPGEAEPGILRFVRLAVDDAVAAGRIDREVEFVAEYGLGLPSGTAAAVEAAYERLANRDVLAVIGPAIGDNALVTTPLADRFGIPTINYAGTERGRSEWMFHLQVGSHEEEPVVIARFLSRKGAGSVAVVYDRSPIGRRYLGFLVAECEVLGIRVTSTVGIGPLAEDAAAEVAALRATGADSVVYLGLGLAARPVALEIRAAGWDVVRVMNTAGLRGQAPDFGRDIDGWHYVDMFADDNSTLAALLQRLGGGRGSAGPAFGYDLGRLVAEGLARATELTRGGVREGLEQAKWLPAAEGYEGTLLGFGHHDRGALHGRYLVLRQWVDGESIQAERS